VDDLDRCRLDHLLTVMESIKLLLEDDEISRRVQVVMLIEEDVLKHATWEKYKPLAEAEAKKAVGTNYDGKRIVRESFEKLFTAHLRLGSLKPQDVADILFNFGGKNERVEQSVTRSLSDTARDEPSRKAPLNSVVSKSLDGDDDDAQGRQSHDPDPNETGSDRRRTEQVGSTMQNQYDADSTMSLHEKQVVLAAVVQVYGKRQSELGPRALRAIMFRYQLARLLLEELGEKTWSPAVLAIMIVKRHSEGKIDSGHAHSDPDILTRVAEQVA
jgi:hypothetical protein